MTAWSTSFKPRADHSVHLFKHFTEFKRHFPEGIAPSSEQPFIVLIMEHLEFPSKI